MNPVDNSPGVLIASANDVMAMDEMRAAELEEIENSLSDERINSSLGSHILKVFQENKDARLDSGIEEKLLQSLRSYNGHYDPEDLRQIRAFNGSEIYMNLTPTKCRAAMSWIRDIMMPAKENAWSLEPTTLPDIPEEVRATIRAKVDQFMTDLQASEQPQEGQSPAGPAGVAVKLKDSNQLKMDLEEAFNDEVYSLAKREIDRYEKKVADQLEEGGWETALSEFIEDFCVFQVAVMKGPIPVKKTRIVWENGVPVPRKRIVFMNKRVSPLDIYPSPSASGINSGNMCEHLRMHRRELYELIGNKYYKDEEIRKILEDNKYGTPGNPLTTYAEEEKNDEEYKDDNRGQSDLFHGIHYFGSASYQMLKDWGFDESLLGEDELAEFEIEAIMVDDRVIKCRINSDPLLRRPYYKASFQNIPGSWWGRSLPELMRDNQRMCNATARALANNMGVASGPQVEIYIDRLAADEEIEDVYPFKMWQVTSDPTGGGGRAVNFWQPTSNAQELLAVYKEFEIRADDATGIPRYAYGNERTGGAAQTASGLSMLLESASKGIKDAIRHIDEGLVKPRVEYQFYWNMLQAKEENEEFDFSGDVIVVPRGSQTLTMKGAQEMRRNEFLQILGNQQYLQIVGVEGVAEILREMAKALGLGENIIPSRIELKLKQKQLEAQQAQQAQQQMQVEQTKAQMPLQTVQMQIQQAEAASQRNAQLKAAELQKQAEKDLQEMALKAQELQQRREESVNKTTAALTKTQLENAQRDRDTNKQIALSVQSNYKDRMNKES